MILKGAGFLPSILVRSTARARWSKCTLTCPSASLYGSCQSERLPRQGTTKKAVFGSRRASICLRGASENLWRDEVGGTAASPSSSDSDKMECLTAFGFGTLREPPADLVVALLARPFLRLALQAWATLRIAACVAVVAAREHVLASRSTPLALHGASEVFLFPVTAHFLRRLRRIRRLVPSV